MSELIKLFSKMDWSLFLSALATIASLYAIQVSTQANEQSFQLTRYSITLEACLDYQDQAQRLRAYLVKREYTEADVYGILGELSISFGRLTLVSNKFSELDEKHRETFGMIFGSLDNELKLAPSDSRVILLTALFVQVQNICSAETAFLRERNNR